MRKWIMDLISGSGMSPYFCLFIYAIYTRCCPMVRALEDILDHHFTAYPRHQPSRSMLVVGSDLHWCMCDCLPQVTRRLHDGPHQQVPPYTPISRSIARVANANKNSCIMYVILSASILFAGVRLQGCSVGRKHSEAKVTE